MVDKRRKARFGNIRALPSGRYQARYTGPDGRTHKAHTTFETKADAEGWLATVRADIVRETWRPNREAGRHRGLTFRDYSIEWLDKRKVKGKPLQPRTRELYERLLERHLWPTFGPLTLRSIDESTVEEWYDRTAVETPTQRAHAYSLLATILGTAARRRLIPENPANIDGAGTPPKRNRADHILSPAELDALAAAMPDRYRALVLLAGWCALRFGEVTALRRGDVDTKAGIVRVRQAIARTADGLHEKAPKTTAGVRDVEIPPHILPALREHMLAHAEKGADGLVFPARSGGHLAPSTLYRVFGPAREAAGRPDVRFHDLRHAGLTWAAMSGATLAELKGRGGHTSTQAAMIYQGIAAGRGAEIARKMSELAGGSA